MGHVIDASAKFERRRPAEPPLTRSVLERELQQALDEAREMTTDHEPWMAWWNVERNDDGTVKRIWRNRYQSKDGAMILWEFDFSTPAELWKVKYGHLVRGEIDVLGAWTRPLPLVADHPDPSAVFANEVGQRDADKIIGHLRSSGTPGNWGSDAVAHA